MATSWFLCGYEPTEDELRAELAAMGAKHGTSDGPWRPHIEDEEYGFFCDGLYIRYGSLVP
jgi:hypothetical protein